MKAIKTLIFSIFTVVLLLVLGVVILIFTIDPNRLKPILEDSANSKGLTLKMTGDIDWQLYPMLGLSLGEMQLSDTRSGQLMTSIKHTKASVQLMPLFKKQILISGVELVGLQLNYHVNADGSSLWSTVLTEPSNAADTDAPASQSADTPELAIKKIRISNSVLNYKDEQSKQQALVNIIKLNADNFTLTGQPFALDLSVKVDYNDMPSTQLDWQSSITLNLDNQTVNIPSSVMHINTGGNKLKIDLSTNTSWADPLTTEGDIQISSFELPALLKTFAIEPPKTNKSTALKNVRAAFAYSLKGEKLALTDIRLGVDDFSLQGLVKLDSFSAPAIVVDLKGTSIVLDDYLPPKSDAPEASAGVNAAPVPLPIETLKSLNIDANLFIDTMVYSGLELTQNTVIVTAKNGIVKLEELSSNVAEGTVMVKAVLDATGKSEVNLQGGFDSKKINVGTILKTFADLDQLQGLANASVTYTSHGASDKELIDNLSLNGTADSEGLSVTPFNVEQQFCNAIALLQQAESPAHEWPQKTELEPVAIKFSLANNNLKLENLSAEIAHLTGAADGSLNLNTGAFDIPIQLSIGDFAGDIQGCLPIDDKWRKRQLPLRCKGNLSNIGAKTCLPDTKLIGNLVKDKVKETVKAKVNEKKEEELDKVEQKAKEKAAELLKKQLGDEDAKGAEDKLRGIFKQLKGK